MKKIIHYGMSFAFAALLTVVFRGTLDAKCYQERCFSRLEPVTAHDYTQQFNEKRYWLEMDENTGEPFICYQRLFLHPEFFRSPETRCFPAQELQKSSAISNGHQCWYAEGIVLCDVGKKSYTVYPKTKKICGNVTPSNGVVLGRVLNTRDAREAGGPKMCTIVKIGK